MNFIPRKLTTFFLSLLVIIPAAPVFSAELVIHVSEKGPYTNKLQASKVNTVSNLKQAIELAESANIKDLDQIRILLQPGIYKGQTHITRGNSNGIPVIITKTSGNEVIFDGDDKGGTWLTVLPLPTNLSNLKIVGLTIRNYETAIDIKGNRNRGTVWVGGIEIRENIFSKIGDIARTGAYPSTAAIRLVNSDKNYIVKNTFREIKNIKQCALLHAIYVAHGSTDNVIEENTFEDSCGDAVRFRDQSNNNIVRRNIFIDAWSRSPISDWFCNKSKRDDCTKSSGECPSSNIQIEANQIITKDRPAIDLFIAYGGAPPAACRIVPSVKGASIK